MISTASEETQATTSDAYPSRIQPEPRLIKRVDPVVYGKTGKVPRPTVADLESFDRDGFLFYPSLFSPEEIRVYAEELRKLTQIDAKGPQYIREPASGDIRSIFQVHHNQAVFRDLSRDSRLTDVAFALLDSDVYVHQSRVNLKPGFVGKEFYWHSDFETWHVEDGMPRMRAVSCSINLTDNQANNGPIMVIPGSHKWFVACVGATPENHYQQSLRKQEYGVPDKDTLARMADDSGIQAPVGPAGSVLFFDCNVMHGSNGNITPFPRSNIFFVYNSLQNQLVAPFGNIPPRPEFIATRDTVTPLRREASRQEKA